MSIEDNLERIATALERIADGTNAAAFAEAFAHIAPAASEPKASTGSSRQRKNVEREEKVVETPVVEKPAEPEPDPLDDPLDGTPAEVEEVKFTEDQVRAALKDYRTINGQDAMMKVLNDFGGGATGMGSLKQDFYPAVMKEVR